VKCPDIETMENNVFSGRLNDAMYTLQYSCPILLPANVTDMIHPATELRQHNWQNSIVVGDGKGGGKGAHAPHVHPLLLQLLMMLLHRANLVIKINY